MVRQRVPGQFVSPLGADKEMEPGCHSHGLSALRQPLALRGPYLFCRDEDGVAGMKNQQSLSEMVRKP